jgi:uncharacterized protein YeaO (DUF488 family)
MLARYRIIRGARPADEPLPEGIRQDTRKHTQHLLRPTPELVQALLDDPSEASFQAFRRGYLQLLRQRSALEPKRFDALAELARTHDVYIGCNCPSARQPDVKRCHTTLALGFFHDRYPDLPVRPPK